MSIHLQECYHEEISKDCLEVFADVIGSCLQQDSSKRSTMDVVVLDLESALRLQEQEDEADNLQVFVPRLPAQETRSEHEHVDTVVLDIGGAITKVGFSGDDSPWAFRTGVYVDINHMTEERLNSPYKDGILSNTWEYKELLYWSLKYNSKINPSSHPVLLTEPAVKYDMSIRENQTNVLFDVFNVPAMYIAPQPVLSLYAHGHTTGIVVESGEGHSYSVPIYEGHALPHAITSLKFAGHGLTNFFMKTLDFNST